MKDLPKYIKINIPFEKDDYEKILFHYYLEVKYKNGYRFRPEEFNEYCAIIIHTFPVDKIPAHVIDYAFKDFEHFVLNDSVNFRYLRLKYLHNEIKDNEISDLLKYYKIRRNERYLIIKKEINRTNISLKDLASKYDRDLTKLFEILYGFETDIVIDWTIPIYLDFERLVHIFVKHVKETKFGIGTFKKRTFFEYKAEDIQVLIKMVLQKDEIAIKDHFLLNSIDLQKKDYRRSIMFNGDEYSVDINWHGKIMRFHQK